MLRSALARSHRPPVERPPYDGYVASISPRSNGKKSHANRSSVDPSGDAKHQQRYRRSWHLPRVVKPVGCPGV